MRKINKIKLFINDNEKSKIVAKDLELELKKYDFKIVSRNYDLAISIGGDGSFLRMVKDTKFNENIYYIGINGDDVMKSSKLIEIFKQGNMVIPLYLLQHYKDFKLKLDEFIFLMYLYNLGEKEIKEVGMHCPSCENAVELSLKDVDGTILANKNVTVSINGKTTTIYILKSVDSGNTYSEKKVITIK